jgi:glycosyltransferase involved in cell wall biosynthesis
VSNRSLTIVLPIYNGESRLSACAKQVLELASELTPEFSILIVDDGSTDDTTTVARELASRYPQITVRRYRERQGLGPIIKLARRHASSDIVIVHDGVSPIDPAQVRRLWQQSVAKSWADGEASRNDLSDLASVREIHISMAKVHERIVGFHLLQPASEAEAAVSESNEIFDRADRPSKPQPTDRASVGQIPPLPRPNFLSAVAQFALGE